MRKLLLKNILFLFFSFFLFSAKCDASVSGKFSGKNTYAQLFADEEKEKKESKITSEKFFDKKSLFESEESVVFEKDDDILNAPPDLGEGTFPPGGQVNPDLPLEDSHYVLLVLTLLYGITRLFFSFRKR